MPLLVTTAGVAVVGTVTSTGGQARPVVNTFVYRTDDVIGAGALNFFVAAFDTSVWANVAPLLHADYSGVSYVGYLPAVMAQGFGTTFPNARNGAVVGGRLPTHQAVNMILRTALRGKNYQGWKRFGPVALAHVSGDELNAAGLAAWTPAAALLLSTFTDGATVTWRPVVLSRQLSPPPPPPFRAFGADLTQVFLNKTLGVARHRRERTRR